MTADLRQVSDAEIIAEIERRAGATRPLLAACPECDRTDAIVALHCADHGVMHFPLRARAVAQLEMKIRPLLQRAARKGITLEELGVDRDVIAGPASPGQIRAFHAICNEIDNKFGYGRGVVKERAKGHASMVFSREIAHVNELNEVEMGLVLDWLSEQLGEPEEGATHES